jgi:hypothetical protein
MSPVLMSTRTGGATAPTGSGTFWEVAVDDLPYGQLQEEERLMTSSSDLNTLSTVNCMSQAEVTVHNTMPGKVRRRTHSSRSSIVSCVSSRRDFANARSGINRVAREGEMQVQNEEVTLRDSTVEAQLLAQGRRAHAATAAKAAKEAVDQDQAQVQAAQAQAQAAQAQAQVAQVQVQAQAQAAQAQAQAAQAQAEVAWAQSLADEAADALTCSIKNNSNSSNSSSINNSCINNSWINNSCINNSCINNSCINNSGINYSSNNNSSNNRIYNNRICNSRICNNIRSRLLNLYTMLHDAPRRRYWSWNQVTLPPKLKGWENWKY